MRLMNIPTIVLESEGMSVETVTVHINPMAFTEVISPEEFHLRSDLPGCDGARSYIKYDTYPHLVPSTYTPEEIEKEFKRAVKEGTD